MKRTKSMIYKPTQEATELYLYATNCGNLWRQNIEYCIKNLEKKYKKGVYDSDKAVDLFYYTMTTASNMYKKEFGYSFSVQDRFTAATDLEAYIRSDYLEA